MGGGVGNGGAVDDQQDGTGAKAGTAAFGNFGESVGGGGGIAGNVDRGVADKRGEAVVFGASGGGGGSGCTPRSRNSWTISRLASCEKKRWTDAATIGPISGTSSSSAIEAL